MRGMALDLTSISAPITKLVEVVAKGCGVLYEPTRIVREAKANAKADLILADTNIRVDEIKRRAAARLVYTEIARQENIEAIVDKAARQLPSEVDPEPVDQDWSRLFFSAAQDVSDDEVQEMWARILAGEVAIPGSFSRRAIEALRVMNKHEASLLSALTTVTCLNGGWEMYFRASSVDYAMKRELGAFDWERCLIDIGILDSKLIAKRALEVDGFEFVFGEARLVLNRYNPAPDYHNDDVNRVLHWRTYTPVGHELARVVRRHTNERIVGELRLEIKEHFGMVLESSPASDERPGADD
jgi:hypothetical protein